MSVEDIKSSSLCPFKFRDKKREKEKDLFILFPNPHRLHLLKNGFPRKRVFPQADSFFFSHSFFLTLSLFSNVRHL